MSTTPQQPTSGAVHTTNAPTSASDASSKLTEAIDDFLSDIEKKFKNVSNEILTKLDDMAERCDRLEQEMLMRETTGSSIDTRSKSTLVSGDGGNGTS